MMEIGQQRWMNMDASFQRRCRQVNRRMSLAKQPVWTGQGALRNYRVDLKRQARQSTKGVITILETEQADTNVNRLTARWMKADCLLEKPWV